MPLVVRQKITRANVDNVIGLRSSKFSKRNN